MMNHVMGCWMEGSSENDLLDESARMTKIILDIKRLAQENICAMYIRTLNDHLWITQDMKLDQVLLFS